MSILINLDLQAIISAAVTTENIQPLVEKAISSAIKNSIEEATGYNSQFRKDIKAQLEASLPHGLDLPDIVKFQQVFNASMAALMQGVNNDTLETAMKKVSSSLIDNAPIELKISELVQEARGGFHKEDHESFYALLKMSDNGYGHLFLDMDEDCRGEYSAGYNVAFNKEGEVYAVKFDGRDLTIQNRPTVINHFDSLMMAMYVGRTKLVIDIDEDEVENLADSKEFD